jgi:thermitase
MKRIVFLMAAFFSGSLMAAQLGDMLVKVDSQAEFTTLATLQARLPMGTKVESLGINGWVHVKLPDQAVSTFSTNRLLSLPGVLKVQPNYEIRLLEDYQLRDEAIRQAVLARIQEGGLPFPGQGDAPAADNPDIPMNGSGGSGADPLFSKQWGMNQLGVREAWNRTKGSQDVIVAVIDTGVDYTHEDLVDNMWRNPREIPNNNKDDDGNGFVDDLVGWDFVANDNKPYDLTANMIEMLTSGGNPGHGTHCAGNVAARGDNGKGIAGVAPNVKIMALRFISEKGGGSTADAIKAIKYAIDNGAKVLSNSWGSEGEDPQDPDTNALKDAIAFAEQKGVLFIAAAGNGHQGVGYDNDTDSKPAYPASYANDIIISVAAVDEAGNLGGFSNWGQRSVDLGAPGVKVFSTVTQSSKYSDTVIDIPGLITATWDGTSMATPHVAGAAALYWSLHPEKNWRDVKNAILNSVKKTSVLGGKTVSGGQLDVANLIRM